ncbi:MAG: transposase [Methylococcales symbiont of Hymedesmia sp. n. MRB-2018]|nr:MAG: transposase [Methylococcales symbiont of Hymedesmia sp. n. MRB-2018]KAF3983863.1 MAG: transposase [Methylococcales symbiont of Hymedesmia sp. n. MRB-2018]
MNKKVATTFIEPWCQKIEQSKMQPFMTFVKTVKSYLSGIVNFVETDITNAIVDSNLERVTC